MIKRLVLAVLISVFVVPLLPIEVREALGLHGITGIIIVLFMLLGAEYLAKIVGAVRGPRGRGRRRHRRPNVEHHPSDYPPPPPQPVPEQPRPVVEDTVAMPEQRPVAPAPEAAPERPRPARRHPRLSGGPK